MSDRSGPSIDAEDVDDIVGIAAEMMQRDEGRLAAEDLQAVGRELDIPPEYMERARAELARRRTETARRAAAKKALRRKLALGGALVLLLGAGIAALAYSSTADELRALHRDVAAGAAQVRNVQDRRAAIDARLGHREPTPDVDAELIGAENRVRVEAQRYAQVAARYNEVASSGWASWVASIAGLPDQVPLELE